MIKDWTTLVISLLSLIGGTGWIMFYLKIRHNKRKYYQNILESFLIPFEGILNQTRLISQELLCNEKYLEYFPNKLENDFNALPDTDPRKFVWRQRIERLHAENLHAIELINRFYDKIMTNDFKKACDQFKFHVGQWEDVWRTKEGQTPSEGEEKPYRANPFPDEIETSLNAEIEKVKKFSSIPIQDKVNNNVLKKNYKYKLKDRDYLDLWMYFEEVGGKDKDRMVTIVTWLLAFAAVILSYIITQSDLDPTQRAILALIGIFISSMSSLFIYAYGAYANRYWYWADLLKEYIIEDLNETHKTEVFINAIDADRKKRFNRLSQGIIKFFSRRESTTEGLVGVFRILLYLSLVLSLVFIIIIFTA